MFFIVQIVYFIDFKTCHYQIFVAYLGFFEGALLERLHDIYVHISFDLAIRKICRIFTYAGIDCVWLVDPGCAYIEGLVVGVHLEVLLVLAYFDIVFSVHLLLHMVANDLLAVLVHNSAFESGNWRRHPGGYLLHSSAMLALSLRWSSLQQCYSSVKIVKFRSKLGAVGMK